MNKKLTAKIKSLPPKPGVYLFQDKTGRLLYIGKANNLRNRVQSHFNPSSQSKFNPPAPPLAKGGLGGIFDIHFIITANEKEALILENELIKKYQPKYNIQWRDDKSYFWVNFTNDEWPRVQTTHRASLQGTARGGTTKRSRIVAAIRGIAALPAVARNDSFIGPFINGRELKQVLRALRKILPYRTCKNAYDKPCLQWHLGLCPAHKSINSKQLTVNNKIQQKNTYLNSLNTFRQLLRLYAGEQIKIEAYDISNIQGASATGSMIVFKGFQRDRSRYRKFRIKTVFGSNDIAMLKEVLRRRLNHREWPYPDLILIDGGRAQLNATAPLTQREGGGVIIPILALAKKDERLYTIYSAGTLRLAALPVSFRLLLAAIRDEAHRFAIAYYRKLHRKKNGQLTAGHRLRTAAK